MNMSDYTVRYLANSLGSQTAANNLKAVLAAAEGDIDTLEGEEHAVTTKVTVDASAGGVAQSTAIVTLAIGSILHDVVVVADTAFDGNATTTLEVGIAANADKYIDTTDFDPSDDSTPATQAMTGGGSNDQGTAEYITASTPIVAIWTNNAAASAGSVDVYVTYTPPIT